MVASLTRRARSALLWRGLQLFGTQLVSFVRTVVLARILLPEHFGVMAVGLVTLHTTLTLTDLGMVPALVQAEETDDRHYNAGWTVGLLRSALVAGVIFFAAPWVASAFSQPASVWVIRGLALRPILEASASIKSAFLIKTLNFRALAIMYLAAVLSEAAVSISLATRLGVWALVVGALAGAAVLSLTSYMLAPHRPRFVMERAVVRPLVKFGRWIFVTGLLGTLASACLQLVISRKLGAASLGVYSLATRLAYLPGLVSSKLVAEVSFPIYARLRSTPVELARAFQATLQGLGGLLVPAYVFMIVLAPQFVDTILGTKWEGTAEIVQILAVAGLLGLFGDAVVPLVKGIGRPEKAALLEGVQALVIVSLVWYLTDAYGLGGAAAAWIPATVISQVFAVAQIRGLVLGWSHGLGKKVLAVGLSSVLSGMLAYSVAIHAPGKSGFFVGAGAGLLLLVASLWAFDALLSVGILKDLSTFVPGREDLPRVHSRTGNRQESEN